MANHKSAEKCARQAEKRTLINKTRMSRIRTFVKRAEQSVAVKELTNPNESREALVKAESELMKGVRKGLFHRNTVARKISRLSQKLKALSLAK